MDLKKILATSSFYSLFNGNHFKNGFPHKLVISSSTSYHQGYSFAEFEKTINSGLELAGYISYDFKNEIENLKSNNPHTIPCSHFGFFEIEKSYDLSTIDLSKYNTSPPIPQGRHIVKCSYDKNYYVKQVKELQNNIEDGDIYEVNFCIEFVAENVDLDPFDMYIKLNQHSPTPFSCLMRLEDTYIISASPERFIKKKGDNILSQPIKGTSPRFEDPIKDIESRNYLQHNEKEKAENLMIVDLVRNDLKKSCQAGSIKVDELFGIYSFKQVHQMISTISGKLKSDKTNAQIIQNAFPMGSMTGAPKIRAMEIIEEIEESRRGVFSGTVGYIDSKGDFDFNVIIRSIIYNSTSKKLSFHVGSAITYDSIPEMEYEECLLKAKAIMHILGVKEVMYS